MTEPARKLDKEDRADWIARKSGQARRFIKLDPTLSLSILDLGTTFILIRSNDHRAYIIGRLPSGSKRGIDATDTQVEKWVKGTMPVPLKGTAPTIPGEKSP